MVKIRLKNMIRRTNSFFPNGTPYIANYDGQFKTGIPEGLLSFHDEKDQNYFFS